MGKRRFMGRSITKETVAIGVGGQIVRDDGFPELPPKARVHVDVWMDFDNVKHKFLDKGGVEETLILTIDTDTFSVVDVEEAPIQEELPVGVPDAEPEPVGAGAE